jgi:hypothetical protein
MKAEQRAGQTATQFPTALKLAIILSCVIWAAACTLWHISYGGMMLGACVIGLGGVFLTSHGSMATAIKSRLSSLSRGD